MPRQIVFTTLAAKSPEAYSQSVKFAGSVALVLKKCTSWFNQNFQRRKRRELPFREHGNIIDALESQDRIAYAFFTSNHLDRGLEVINENLSNDEVDL
ncbi:hypothetical protein N9357_04235 [bacterium]|nr:hypothetical protein [bacterium]